MDVPNWQIEIDSLSDRSTGHLRVKFFLQGQLIPVRPIMSAMLDLSLFSETTEMFLRSDSIKDLAERLDLVKSLLGLLKAMILQDEYRSILTRPRRLKKRTRGLQGIAQSPPGTAVTSVIILEDEKEPSHSRSSIFSAG